MQLKLWSVARQLRRTSPAPRRRATRAARRVTPRLRLRGEPSARTTGPDTYSERLHASYADAPQQRPNATGQSSTGDAHAAPSAGKRTSSARATGAYWLDGCAAPPPTRSTLTQSRAAVTCCFTIQPPSCAPTWSRSTRRSSTPDDPDPARIAASHNVLANGCDSPLYNVDIQTSEPKATLDHARSGV